MDSFLRLVADDIYRKMKGDFQDTTIIFPNKRASLFFSQYLWENAGGRVIWAPEYTTISELFTSLSDYTVGDGIYLVVKLYEVYCKVMGSTRSLDQVYGLMETMLGDFQDIDNNMVDPRRLFVNIADIKDMTDFSFLDDEQRIAIEQFFGRFFDNVDPDTQLKTRFRSLWNRLPEIYELFQQSLLGAENPLVYEGMLKKRVIERLTGGDEEARGVTDARLRARTYVMVGFNVLSETEMALFRYMKQNRDAKFYWDYDVAYMGGKRGYEAGQFIAENRARLGDELSGMDYFANMRARKRIRFIQSPTDNAQARYVGTWVAENVGEAQSPQESAVVLCDEGLLMPVLHSIGGDGRQRELNVTMGYPMSGTAVFSLMQLLLELQVRGKSRSGAWRYRQVAAVLRHPFVQMMSDGASTARLGELTSNNVVFPAADTFADDGTLGMIFTPVAGKRLTEYLAEVVSMAGVCYQEKCKTDFDVQMQKEAIFIAYTTLNRIRLLQDEHEALNVGGEMLARIIMQQMRGMSIPFHGEPAVGLQVMGLLETRNLDFRNVVMLSVNEGQLPKSDKRPSLIPYTLRAAYGMTTMEKEVSLYAYYYYRLLERAENVTLLYNSSTEGGKKGEMSRFMLQTLVEREELLGKENEIELMAFTSVGEPLQVDGFKVVKNKEVMQRLHTRFEGDNILSPSAIITYMKCPLKFYFNYVAGVRPDKEVSEDVDKPMFGTIFHYVMQKLYEPHVGMPMACETLRRMAEDEALITQKLNNAFAVNLFQKREKDPATGCEIDYSPTLNGTQLINRHVIKDFVVNQITADMRMAEQLESEGGHLEVMALEQKYTTRIELKGAAEGRTLTLGGYIDRLDWLFSPQGSRVRIVDYKTSSQQQSAANVAELFDKTKRARNYQILQTFYYAKVLSDPANGQADKAVCPSLMYCPKRDERNFSGIVKMENAQVLNKAGKPVKMEIEDFKLQYGEEFSRMLQAQIDEIFSPYDSGCPEKVEGWFAQCDDEANCQFCDFIKFCRRAAGNEW